MFIINIINYIIKKLIKVYLFAFCMVSENTSIGNIIVFENFNIGQLGLDKDDFCFEKHLTF